MKRKVSRVALGILLGLSLILGSWILLSRAALAASSSEVKPLLRQAALQTAIPTSPRSFSGPLYGAQAEAR